MSHPDASAFLALFALSFLLRLWPFFTILQSWEDGYFYIELARSLSQGHWSLLGEFHTKYLPGYPAAILLAKVLTLGIPGWFKSAQLVNLLSLSAASGLCYVLAFDLTRDRRAAWAAGILAALNAQLVANAGVPFTEGIFGFQALLVLVLLTRRPMLAGALAGWATVTRHEGWFLAPAFLITLLYSDKKKRLAGGLALMAVMGTAWWILARLESGAWLYQTYLDEAAARGETMGKSGVNFLLLAFPSAGVIATAFAIVGLGRSAAKKEAWPALAYLVLYLALHSWWMFPVERYYPPITPLLCVLAGVGMYILFGLARGENWPGAARRYALPAIAFSIGLVHFIGFAPSTVKEEAERTRGYREAIEYVAARQGDFAVMAYDAFMEGVHDGKHPVVPTGMVPPADFDSLLPRLISTYGIRYIIWCNVYPVDRALTELNVVGSVDIGPLTAKDGTQYYIVLDPVKTIQWQYYYPEPSRFAFVRKLRKELKTAVVYKVRFSRAKP